MRRRHESVGSRKASSTSWAIRSDGCTHREPARRAWATGHRRNQRCDLEADIDAMKADCGALADTVLRVDGGMAASDWTMQRLADILGAPVDRPRILETTALFASLER